MNSQCLRCASAICVTLMALSCPPLLSAPKNAFIDLGHIEFLSTRRSSANELVTLVSGEQSSMLDSPDYFSEKCKLAPGEVTKQKAILLEKKEAISTTKSAIELKEPELSVLDVTQRLRPLRTEVHNAENKLAQLEFEQQAVCYRKEYEAFVRAHTSSKAIANISDILGRVPKHTRIARPYTHHSSYVDAMISGGTWRPFSLAVARNHAAYARVRNIAYKFVSLDDEIQSEITREVNEKLAGKKPYWAKLFLIQTWLERNYVRPGKWVLWIDDDIVINDFKNKQSALDRLIKKGTSSTCIITTDDIWKIDDLGISPRANTGMILVRNTRTCRDLVTEWLNYFYTDTRLATGDQDRTLHEQESLERLTDRHRRILEKLEGSSVPISRKRGVVHNSKKIDFLDDKNIKEVILTLRNRDHNFTEAKNKVYVNTFKRFGYKNKDGTSNFFSLDFEHELAALPGDHFIHHTGMPVLLRTLLIAHTLKEVEGSYPLKVPGS